MASNQDAAQVALAKKVFFDVPVVAGISGLPGLGKTVDCIYSFPRALFIASEGALKPAVPVVGHVPSQVTYAGDISEIMKAVQDRVKKPDAGIDAVVIDDFGSAVSATELAMMGQEKDGRRMYKNLTLQVRRLIDLFRDLKVHVIMSTHKKEAKAATSESAAQVGGPALPGQLMSIVPSMTDLWVNMFHDPMRQGYPVSYAAGLCPQGGQGTRDRHEVCGDRSPANIGELLRVAGYKIRRAPGLEWQEEAIEKMTEAVLNGQATIEQVAAYAVEECRRRGAQNFEIRWLLRDLAARVEIRKNIAERQRNAFAYLGVSL